MASMVTCQSSCKLSLMASQHSLDDVLLSSVFQLKTKIEESHYHNAGCVHSQCVLNYYNNYYVTLIILFLLLTKNVYTHSHNVS